MTPLQDDHARAVPPSYIFWLERVFRLIRCKGVTHEEFFREWFAAGRDLNEINEGEVSNFLLAKGMISKQVWEDHLRMAIVKMFSGPNERYAGNIEACAEACRIDLDFARNAVRGLSG